MRQAAPPARAWTWPAKLCVAVAGWTSLLAGFDYVTGQGWWALALGALAVLNLVAALRLVHSTVRWQQAHERQHERA